MRVTKIGHSCLVIEEGSLKLVIDPGNYNPVPQVEGLDVILITHERLLDNLFDRVVELPSHR